MIDLTPLEVRQKKGDFRRAFRGYDAELVNDFLDLVADRMEELVKRNMDLTESVRELESEVDGYRDKERALSDALMTAQKLQEEARRHAEKEGELLIREARQAAESARQEAERALIREEDSLRQVRARRSQLIESFRRLLEREIGELAVIEKSLELETAPQAQPQPRPGPERPAPSAGGREAASAEPAEGAERETSEPAVSSGEGGPSGEVREDPSAAAGAERSGEAEDAARGVAGETAKDRAGGGAERTEPTASEAEAGAAPEPREGEGAAGEPVGEEGPETEEASEAPTGRPVRRREPPERDRLAEVGGAMAALGVEWPDPAPGAGEAEDESEEPGAPSPTGQPGGTKRQEGGRRPDDGDDDDDEQEDWLKSLVEEER